MHRFIFVLASLTKGVRVLDGPVSDSLEAEAISFNRDYIDIYSASWGPSDDGSTMEGPRHLALGALVDGVKKVGEGKAVHENRATLILMILLLYI